MSDSSVGFKVKVVATAVYVLTIISGVACGIFLININMEVAGILSFVLGPIVGLVPYWLIYGFGELVENSEDIRSILISMKENNKNKEKQSEVKIAQARPSSFASSDEWRCTCGKIHKNYVTSCSCGKNQREVLVEQNNK